MMIACCGWFPACFFNSSCELCVYWTGLG